MRVLNTPIFRHETLYTNSDLGKNKYKYCSIAQFQPSFKFPTYVTRYM